MRPGKGGEAILESRLESRYVKFGARRLGNEALVNHVKSTPFNDEREKVLNSDYAGDVQEALCEVIGMDGILAASLLISPFTAQRYLKDLRQVSE